MKYSLGQLSLTHSLWVSLTYSTLSGSLSLTPLSLGLSFISLTHFLSLSFYVSLSLLEYLHLSSFHVVFNLLVCLLLILLITHHYVQLLFSQYFASFLWVSLSIFLLSRCMELWWREVMLSNLLIGKRRHFQFNDLTSSNPLSRPDKIYVSTQHQPYLRK